MNDWPINLVYVILVITNITKGFITKHRKRFADIGWKSLTSQFKTTPPIIFHFSRELTVRTSLLHLIAGKHGARKAHYNVINRFKKRRKHLSNLGSLEKDCFWTKHFRLAFFRVQRESTLRRKRWSIYYHQLHRKICNKKGEKGKGLWLVVKGRTDWDWLFKLVIGRIWMNFGIQLNYRTICSE